MVGPTVNPFEPVPLTTTPRAGELKMGHPKPFTGKRSDLDKFLQEVELYLEINDEIYDTDKKKIAFTLSFMTEGDAESWKGGFLRNAKQPTGGLNLGTWAQFQTDIVKDFKPYDAPGDALEELTNLQMGTNSIEDHIARYKALLSAAGVADTSPPAIDYFRKSLNIPLQRKILELPTQPKDLKEWYEWASRLDNNYRRMQRILGRPSDKPSDKGKNGPKRWTFSGAWRDPNTMDVDAMTLEKQTEMMRKGLCFRCEKPGHLSRDCPEKQKTPTQSASTTPKKMNPRELVAHIRSLTATLDEKEKEEFFGLADEGDF